jgi:SAM-dependent methyltransferase
MVNFPGTTNHQAPYSTMITAQLYQLLVYNLSSDLIHYRGQISPEKGPILELGIGTGRTLFPLAKDGFSCVAIEKNDDMIEFCHQALQAQNYDVSIIQGDMCSFTLPNMFQQIQVPLRSIQLLAPSQREQTMECIHQHLADHGQVIFHIYNWKRSAHVGLWQKYTMLPTSDGGKMLIEECSTIERDQQGAEHLHILHRFQSISPQHLVSSTHVTHQKLYPVLDFSKELYKSGLHSNVLFESNGNQFIQAKKR